jgi:DNA topoisomerase-1
MVLTIYRKKIDEKNKIYQYTDLDGKIIKDKKILDYIKGLPPIAPAYDDVIIFYEKNPRILYEGRDKAGRLQQIYSPVWRKKADKEKFKSLIEFGKKLPTMIINMHKNIKSKALIKDKVISIILLIITLCGFRLGSLKYQKLYNSTGLITLKKKHLAFKIKKLEISFIGKKGVKNDCSITDQVLIDEMKKIAENKKNDDFLFIYEIENADKNTKNEQKMITANDINDWLKSYNPDFTSKYIRTYEVNVLLISMLKDTEPSKMTITQRKKKVTDLIKEVSCEINNSPAICKKSYLSKELIELYIEHPKKYENELIKNDYSPRVNFIKFLENLYN